MKNMKKVALGLFVAATFIVYSLHGRNETSTASVATKKAAESSAGTATNPTAPTAKTSSTQYKDGSYTGSAADALYGYIQIQAVVQGGKLTDVVFVQYPNDRSTSREINSQAMPALKQEAITAQNAQVDGVSGATDSSQAFIQSLGSALQQAKA
jgi:uncharacterized protein with FMN-binding domain